MQNAFIRNQGINIRIIKLLAHTYSLIINDKRGTVYGLDFNSEELFYKESLSAYLSRRKNGIHSNSEIY